MGIREVVVLLLLLFVRVVRIFVVVMRYTLVLSTGTGSVDCHENAVGTVYPFCFLGRLLTSSPEL